MAEELLDKARDLVEGHIVRNSARLDPLIPSTVSPWADKGGGGRRYSMADQHFPHQDFDGQRRAEGLATLFLSISAVCASPFSKRSSPIMTNEPPLAQLLAFNIGYFYQDIQKAVFIGLGGTALTFLLVVPPWPFYKKNPVKWLPAGSGWQ